jgi:hypothetical protein
MQLIYRYSVQPFGGAVLLVLVGDSWFPDNLLFFSKFLEVACHKFLSAVRSVAATSLIGGFVPAKKISKDLDYFIFNRNGGDLRYLDIII